MGLRGSKKAAVLGQQAPVPSLDLNFLSGALDSRLTFTRASTAWYYNSAGVLTSAATNVARFDCDPVTLLPLGLLIEEARTNLFLNSAVGVTQSCTVTAAAHTLSFFGTGTITLTGTSTAGPLVGTGANNRVTLTFTPTAGSLTLTVSGSCTNVQLELGAFATSPIVTVGATVTRAADVCTIATLGSWFNAAAGTLIGEWVVRGVKATGVQTVVSIDDGTNTQRVTIFASNAGGQPQASGTATTTFLSVFRGTVAVAGATEKMAIVWDAASSRAYLNSALLGGGSAGAPVVTQMRIGHRTTDQLGGWVRRLRYFDTRLPNPTLQRLTT